MKIFLKSLLLIVLIGCSDKKQLNFEIESDLLNGKVTNVVCNQFDSVYHYYVNVNTETFTVSFSGRAYGYCESISELKMGSSVYFLSVYIDEINNDFILEKFKLNKFTIIGSESNIISRGFILQNNKKTIRIYIKNDDFKIEYPDSINILLDPNKF